MIENEIMLVAKNHVKLGPQLLKLSEESCELSAAVLRFMNQAPWSRSEDTLFMEMLEEIQQVKIYLDEEMLQIIRRKKLDRYERRISSL